MQIPENKMQLLKGLAFISSILAILLIFVAVENRLNVEKQIDQPIAATYAKEVRELRARVTRLELDVAKLQEAQKQQAK